MSGRRERQKQARRAVMLSSAAALFDKNGFDRTTFDEIAADAGVGVATVYKYFSSKQGIVVALLEPELSKILERAQRVIEQRHTDPGSSMVALLSAYRELGGHNWASREILRLTIFPGIGNEGRLTELIHQAESQTQMQIRRLLEVMQAAGLLKANLPLGDATAVIFALLNQHFALHLSDSTLAFGTIFRRLARCIRLVFCDWRR